MTPLKRMAYAHCRARATPESDKVLGVCDPDGDCACVGQMRAALLALASADLPDDVFIRTFGELTSDDFDKIGHGEAEAVFRAMCLAIAESGT